jgi:hypothetical protein
MRAVLTLLVCGITAGCATPRSGGPGSADWLATCDPAWEEGCPTREEREADAQEMRGLALLLERGRFDLQCPDASAVVLERHSSGPATLVGVSGCGKQTQYERRLRRSLGGATTENTKWARRG